MKTIRTIIGVAFVALLTLTSCLNGDGKNEDTIRRIGKLSTNMYGTTLFYCADNDLPIYLSNAQSLLLGEKYLLATFTINWDEPANDRSMVEKNQYYTASLVSEDFDITGYYNEITELDDTIQENESKFAGFGIHYVVDKTLFAIFQTPSIPKNSKVTYTLEYDPNQEVKKETVSGFKDPISVYDLYIRVQIDESAESSKSAHEETVAFELGSSNTYNSIVTKEYDNYYFAFRINIVKEFDNKEGTVKEWNQPATIGVYTGKKAS